MSIKVATTLKNHLQNVFSVSENTSIEDVCDMIRNQWQVYQLQDIPREWHKVETETAKKLEEIKNPIGKMLRRAGLTSLQKNQKKNLSE